MGRFQFSHFMLGIAGDRAGGMTGIGQKTQRAYIFFHPQRQKIILTPSVAPMAEPRLPTILELLDTNLCTGTYS